MRYLRDSESFFTLNRSSGFHCLYYAFIFLPLPNLNFTMSTKRSLWRKYLKFIILISVVQEKSHNFSDIYYFKCKHQFPWNKSLCRKDISHGVLMEQVYVGKKLQRLKVKYSLNCTHSALGWMWHQIKITGLNSYMTLDKSSCIYKLHFPYQQVRRWKKTIFLASCSALSEEDLWI